MGFGKKIIVRKIGSWYDVRDSIAIFSTMRRPTNRDRVIQLWVSSERFSDRFFVSQREKERFYGLQKVCPVSLLTPEAS